MESKKKIRKKKKKVMKNLGARWEEQDALNKMKSKKGERSEKINF